MEFPGHRVEVSRRAEQFMRVGRDTHHEVGPEGWDEIEVRGAMKLRFWGVNLRDGKKLEKCAADHGGGSCGSAESGSTVDEGAAVSFFDRIPLALRIPPWAAPRAVKCRRWPVLRRKSAARSKVI